MLIFSVRYLQKCLNNGCLVKIKKKFHYGEVVYYIVTLELRGIYSYANRILNFSQPLFWISHKNLRGVWNTWTVNKFIKHLLWKAISAKMSLGAALAWNSDKNIRRGESKEWAVVEKLRQSEIFLFLCIGYLWPSRIFHREGKKEIHHGKEKQFV